MWRFTPKGLACARPLNIKYLVLIYVQQPFDNRRHVGSDDRS
jgi:hypothetical protein